MIFFSSAIIAKSQVLACVSEDIAPDIAMMTFIPISGPG